jgi:hypothetical protein
MKMEALGIPDEEEIIKRRREKELNVKFSIESFE